MVNPVPPPAPKEPSRALRLGLIAAAGFTLIAAWMIASVMLASPNPDPSLRAKFLALPQSVQPDPDAPSQYPDLLAKLAEFDAIVQQIEAEAWIEAQERSITGLDRSNLIDFGSLAPDPDAADPEATTLEAMELRTRSTQIALDRMENANLFDDIAAILRSDNLANTYASGVDENDEPRALYLVELPELGRMRHFSMAQLARVRLARERGNPQQAAALLGEIAPLPVALTRQATVIEHLVGYAIAELILTEARAIATDPNADAATPEALKNAIDPLNNLNSPRVAFEGERLGSRDAHDRTHTAGGRLIPSAQAMFMGEVGAEEGHSPQQGTLDRLADIRGYAYASREDSLEFTDGYYDLITRAIDETNPLIRDRLLIDAVHTVQEASWRYPLPRLLLPALNRFVTQWHITQQSVSITRTMIAMARFRADQGHWPETLDQLVPDYLDTIPINPQTGNPFEYDHTPGEAPSLESFGFEYKFSY